jgi:quercetin dioxygenase-like cupin family protein
MGLRHFRAGESKRVRAPFSGGPGAEVLIGADDGWPMGVARVTIPAGGGMSEHEHGSSAAMVMALDQPVLIVDVAEQKELDVKAGDVVTIPIGDLVEVHNRGGSEATIAVVFNPPDFTSRLDSWPVDEDR